VHYASLHAWWQTTQFFPRKIATTGLRAANCQRQLAAPELPRQFRELVLSCHSKLRPPGCGYIIAKAAIMYPRFCLRQNRGLVLSCHAPGIVAEILFYREAVKKIVAESPVCGVLRRKGAQIPNY
jgi:hypothetical protein